MMLITGATGNFGSAAVAAARQARVSFRALAHSLDKAAHLRAQGIDAAVGDMARPESLEEAFRGVSSLLLIGPSSPTLIEAESQTLDAARQAGVKRVVKVSAFSVGTAFQAGLGDLHAAAEARLRESGLEWTVLRPAATMGTPLQVGAIEGGVLYAPAADGVAAYCAPHDAGELAVRLLEQGGVAAKAYAVTGPEALDMARVAQIVAAQTGRPLRFATTSEEDHARRLAALGRPKPAIELALSFFRRVRAGAFTEVLHTTEQLIHRPGTSYADWARANAARLLP